MHKLCHCLIPLLLLTAGCNDPGRKTPEEQAMINNAMQAPDPRLMNNIEIKENGLSIVSARLLLEDGSLLPPGNAVGVGEIIYCQLFVSGWQVENGIVRPGAFEVIRTGEGEVILGEEDLFRNVPGATEEDARVVTLRAGITSLNRPAQEYEVIFRIWDKVSHKELSGSFRFHLK